MPVDRDNDGNIILSDPMGKNGIRQVQALVRFYLHSEPKTFEHLAKEWGDLKFALQFDGKLKISEVKKG